MIDTDAGVCWWLVVATASLLQALQVHRRSRVALLPIQRSKQDFKSVGNSAQLAQQISADKYTTHTYAPGVHFMLLACLAL